VNDRPLPESVSVHDEEGRPVIEVTVAAPVATVWEHLRDPALISRWHGWDYDELDEEIDLIYGSGAREADEPYVLETKGGSAPGSFEQGDRFELVASGDSTVVRITRGPRGTDPDWDAMYDDITQGWVSFLAQLRFVVEAHDDAPRRTVFLHAAGGPSARELLDLAGRDAGEAWSARPSSELELDGRTFFRTGAQTGATVDAYGPGLVVAADKAGPDGAWDSMVIVSTFGLDDATFDEVETAWRRWWVDTHPEPAS
jgi:hypothetical protein